jgi:hypothetical protein
MRFLTAVFYFLVALASASPLSGRHLGQHKHSFKPSKRSIGSIVSSVAAVLIVNDNDGIVNGIDKYTQYAGDGSVAAGWPSSSQWYNQP